MLNFFYKTIREKELKSIGEFKIGCWVHAEDPDGEEIKELSRILEIEESLCLDALDPYEVPRLEREDGVTYFFTRVPEKRAGEIITVPFMIAIGVGFVLTVSREKMAFLDDFKQGKIDFYTTQKIKLFLQLFFAINTQYSIFLNEINKKVRALKIRLESIKTKDIVQFIDLEKILNDFLAALAPTNAALHSMIEGRHITLYERDKDLVEDVSLGNKQLIELSRSTLKYIVNIRDAYSNIMTHELNRVSKVLTSLAIIFTIPTMIFSLYGMNVALPFEQGQYAFWIILFLTGVVTTLAFAIFFRKKLF